MVFVFYTGRLLFSVFERCACVCVRAHLRRLRKFYPMLSSRQYVPFTMKFVHVEFSPVVMRRCSQLVGPLYLQTFESCVVVSLKCLVPVTRN